MAQLFISYASADQAIAMEVCALLEARGVSCWIAPRDVAPGTKWDEAIVGAIRDARAFLLVLTHAANESPYVSNEVNHAFAANKSIFTFRAEDVTPGKSLEFYLARHHWTDGFAGKIENQVAQLAASVMTMVGASEGANVPTADAVRPARIVTRAARRERVAWGVTAAAVIAASLTGVPAIRHLREAPPPTRGETRTSIVTPVTENPWAFAISPDGQQLVFVANSNGHSMLWLRRLANTDAQPLPGTEGALSAFWSPDSKSIGFFANEQLKRLDLAGGVVQPLAPAPDGRGGTWNSDGVILFADSPVGPLLRVPASGGKPVKVTALQQGQNAHRFPWFLADGRHYLFFAVGEVDASGIYLASLDSADVTKLTASQTAGLASPSGWLLWVKDTTLLAQQIDLERRTLIAEPVPLAQSIDVSNGLYLGAFSVSNAGLMAYRTTVADSRSQLTWVDRTGKVLGTLGEPANQGGARIAPDGRRVLVGRAAGGNVDLWILDEQRATRLTSDPAPDSGGAWSPDGTRILYSSNRFGPGNLFIKAANGSGEEVRVSPSLTTNSANDWSPDGRFLLYEDVAAATRRDLLAVPATEADRANQPRAIVKTPFNEVQGRFSPDGRWLAYQSNETGRNEIYIRPFDPQAPAGSGDARRRQISTGGGKIAVWRADGRELYYLGLGENAPVIAVPLAQHGDSLEPGTPVTLFRSGIFVSTDLNRGAEMDVSRDGRFLFNIPVGGNAAQPITLIQNWVPPAGK